MKIKRILSVMFIMVAFAIIGGCSQSIKPYTESPYRNSYNNLFEGVKMPSTSEVLKNARSHAFPESVDKVWEAVLRVSSQYEGFLGIDRSRESHRRLFVVHGRETYYGRPNASPMQINKFLDVWLSVDVQSSDVNRETLVTVAWIPPSKDAINYSKPAQSKFSPSQMTKLNCETRFSFRQRNKKQAQSPGVLAQRLSKFMSSKKKQKRFNQKLLEQWEDIPDVVVNDFFYHLSTQLYCPSSWREKFFAQSSSGIPLLRKLQRIEQGSNLNTVLSNKKALALGNQAGIWLSAKKRRHLVVIRAPEIERILQGVINRLKTVANRTQVEVTPYIVASPEINAFAMPNGDIFVYSGLLNALDSNDELAAVLAHELDHLFQRDGAARLLNRDKRSKQSQIIYWSVYGLGSFIGAGIKGPNMSGYPTPSTTDLIVGNAVPVVSQGVGLSSGQFLEMEMIAGYSQETELRADRNGARYLLAAGYDIDAELRMLGKLKEAREKAKGMGNALASGLVNARPGPEARIEQMQKTIKAMSIQAQKE